MIVSSIPSDHICLTSETEVRSVSEPLFKITGLTYFSYSRYYFSNEFFSLHTNNDYFLLFLQNQSIVTPSLKTGVYLWEHYYSSSQINDAIKSNIGNGFSYVRNIGSYIEYINFASTPQNIKAVDICLNHGEVLNRFCLYFKERCLRLINTAENKPIQTSYNIFNETKSEKFLYDLNSLYKSLPVKRYFINDQYYGIKLSKREQQCLASYIKGLSAKEIALELRISKNTVDSFLHNIKNKFQVHSKSDLLKVLWDLGAISSNGWFV